MVITRIQKAPGPSNLPLERKKKCSFWNFPILHCSLGALTHFFYFWNCTVVKNTMRWGSSFVLSPRYQWVVDNKKSWCLFSHKKCTWFQSGFLRSRSQHHSCASFMWLRPFVWGYERNKICLGEGLWDTMGEKKSLWIISVIQFCDSPSSAI